MEGRLRLLSLDVELALEGGLGALRSDGNRLGGALVPDERFVSLADEETVLAYEVRRVGVGLQVAGVDVSLLYQDVREREREREVAARLDGEPLVGGRPSAADPGVDRHHLQAALLPGPKLSVPHDPAELVPRSEE